MSMAQYIHSILIIQRRNVNNMANNEPNIPLASLPAKKVLEMIVAELRHPINSIQGWAEILSKPEMNEHHTEAVENIQNFCKSVKSTLEAAQSYLENDKR